MKLKQVVGSIFLLGLASSSAFAAIGLDTQSQMDSLRAQVARMEAAMQTNQAGGFEQIDGWFNRIAVSGQANIDAAFANRSPVIFNVNNYASDIFLNNANVFFDSQLSNWTTAHVGLAFGSRAPNFVRVRPGAAFGNPNAASIVDEAYANIANFQKSPFYFKAGKQRIPFGDYVPYADMTPSFTQLLSESHQITANVGFADASGFNGSVYLFRGQNVKIGSLSTTGVTRAQNWGANLGFANGNGDFGYKLGAGYLRNMADVDFISNTVFAGAGISNILFGTVASQTGALSLNADGHWGAFDGALKYVGALQRFSVADVSYTNNFGTTYSGAKPKAWGVDFGYSFPTMGHTSRVGLGYQGTAQTAMVGSADGLNFTVNSMGLPKTRYLVDYTVNVSKYTDLGFQIRNDRNYPRTHRSATAYTGSNGSATTGTVRLAVKFA